MKYFITILLLITTMNLFSQDKELVNTGKQFIVINEENFGYKINGYHDIAFGDDSTVWMISDIYYESPHATLIKFDYKEVETISLEGYSDQLSYSLDVDSKGNVWIGTDKGLVKYNDGFREIFDETNSDLLNPWVTCITVDNEDNIWMCQKKGALQGLIKFDGVNKWEFFTADKGSIPSNEVLKIFIDRDNNIWTYSTISSIEKVEDDYVTLHKNYLSKKNESGYVTILEDKYSTSMYQSGYANVNKLTSDKNGNIYFMQYSGGYTPGFSIDLYYLLRYDGLTTDTIISGFIDVWFGWPCPHFDVDDENNIWLSDHGLFGILKYDGKELDTVLKSNQYYSGLIRAMNIDKFGNIFINVVPDLFNFNDYVAIFREDGVLLSKDAVSVKENIRESNIYLSAHPNPFSQFQIMNYELREAGHVTLKVYDLMGNEVATLVDGLMPAGRHEARFEAAGLPEGVYFLKLQAGKELVTRKFVKF